jgi:GT2 family glycosyltransferase
MQKNDKKIIASIIIPVRTITSYVRETVSFLLKQTNNNFEIIVVTDNNEKLDKVKVVASKEPTPSFKRNLGAKLAKGKLLCFLDDDSYPDKNWLKNAINLIEKEKSNIGAVCGPALTPPSDNIFQKASGCVWESWLGSGGAGVYRNKISSKREVDDFPSVNLIVKKSCFNEIGGFDENHWPGEDTKFCLDLINNGYKIIYSPDILVFHHRRAILVPHLKQISRYAKRRGYFAKNFPATSFRIGYFLPTLFVLGIILGGIFSIFNSTLFNLFLLCLGIYLMALYLEIIKIIIAKNNPILALLTSISIIFTHLTYGLIFPTGYLSNEIKTIPHNYDNKKKVYIGG